MRPFIMQEVGGYSIDPLSQFQPPKLESCYPVVPSTRTSGRENYSKYVV